MNGKKTVKISDVNKEIVEEITEERKAKEISDGIRYELNKDTIIESVNDLDKSVNSLLNITQMLDERIDMVRNRISRLEMEVEEMVNRLEDSI
jgi:peptidoglycan hydrolase CwlO-like protein